jgi:hypothetical protein
MPVVKHVLNFSELITKAAYQRQLSNYKHITHSKHLYSSLNTSSVSYKEERNEDTSSSHMNSEFALPPSSFYRRILLLSAFLDNLLFSPTVYVLRVLVSFTALIIIAFETDSHTSSDDNSLLIFNSLIDLFFGIEGLVKIFTLLTRLSFPVSNLTPATIILTSGLIEFGTTLGSVICRSSNVGAWFRLVRVFFLSVIAVRHAAQLDVLMVTPSPSISSLSS